MNFILSKIISRPKSIVLLPSSSSSTELSTTSDDDNKLKMENNQLKDNISNEPSPVTSLFSLFLSTDQNNESSGARGTTAIGKKNTTAAKTSIGSGDNSTLPQGIENKFHLSSSSPSKIVPPSSINKNNFSSKEKAPSTVDLTNNLENQFDENTELILKAKENHIKQELNKETVDSSKEVNKLNVLPDIINVQPVQESESTEDSLISSLANNLNTLNLNSTKNLTHRNCDGGISSDEELFDECQTFTDTEKSLQQQQQQQNDVNKTKTNDCSWDKILSNVACNENENIQQIKSNIDSYTADGIPIDSTLQDLDYASASASSAANSLIVEAINECVQPKISDHTDLSSDLGSSSISNSNSFEKELDKYLQNKELSSYGINNNSDLNTNTMNLSKAEIGVVIDNQKSEALDSLEKLENEQISELNYDSTDNSDIFIPQVMLRQNKKEFNQNSNIFPTDKNHDNIDLKVPETCIPQVTCIPQEENKNFVGEQSINSNYEIPNKTFDKADLNTVEEIESENMLQSIDSLEEMENNNINTMSNIKSNLSNDKIVEFSNNSNRNSSSLSEGAVAFNQTRNILNNSLPHSDEYVENHNEPKILNQTYDDVPQSPIISNKKTGSLASLTFAASSEAINSTTNFPLQQKSNIPLDESFDVETSFNQNDTLPIDDLNNYSKSSDLKCETQSLPYKINRSQEAVVSSTNDKETLNELNSASVSYNEPMDVDDYIEHQLENSRNQKNIEFDNEINFKNELLNENQLNSNISNDNDGAAAASFPIENEFEFRMPSKLFPPSNKHFNKNFQQDFNDDDDDFQSQPGLILSANDFDFLLSKGSNLTQIQRDSLLLRFDPLLGHAVPVNQIQQQHQQQKQEESLQQQSSSSLSSTSSPLLRISSPLKKGRLLSPTAEEQEQEENFIASTKISTPINSLNNHLYIKSSNHNDQQQQKSNNINILIPVNENNRNNTYINSFRPNTKYNRIVNLSQDHKGDVKMSVDVIQDIKLKNDDVNNKSIDNLSTQSNEKQDKMEDLEKKIQNEVLKTEDIEKKLKDAEQREEALLKRITEKDKTMSKMSGVIEAYEKALAELITEKEQIKQNYEKQIAELKSDRDSNYQHLLSLESTFSDLHVKYERSKQTAEKLKKSEEELLNEKRQTIENLRLQEQRYEKMKNHALQQLEIANNKLETQNKSHLAEVTKLKALLKKEEITRLSIAEQLQQKARENEELMKICDELINGQGS